VLTDSTGKLVVTLVGKPSSANWNDVVVGMEDDLKKAKDEAIIENAH
jgi:hypothetical protein